MVKCPHCEKDFVKYPIFKDKDKKWEKGNVNWKNMFRIDWRDVILVIVILVLLVTYRADISKCDNVIKKPCDFCSKSNCCITQPNSASEGYDNLLEIKTNG